MKCLKRVRDWWGSRYKKVACGQLNRTQFAQAMCNFLGKEIEIQGVYTGNFLGRKLTSTCRGTLEEVGTRQRGEHNVFGVVLTVKGGDGPVPVYFDERFIQKKWDEKGKLFYFLAQKENDFHHFEIRIKGAK